MGKDEATAAESEAMMTVPEVARALRVKASTVYRLAQSGQIPATKVGRQWRFRRDLIDAWFRRGAARERPAPDEGIEAPPEG